MPAGTLDGTLTGTFLMEGDLEGDVTLSLTLSGTTGPTDGRCEAAPGCADAPGFAACFSGNVVIAGVIGTARLAK